MKKQSSNIEEDFKSYPLFWPKYAHVDYQTATEIIVNKARKRISFGVSALAVHGLMTSLNEPELKKAISKIEMIVPDGQPVRWALNSFYHLRMQDRVYGPTLTLHVLERANQMGFKLFLYGSTKETLEKFCQYITSRFPNIDIVGVHPDRFREATEKEDMEDIQKINDSKANVVLVGRGCPRQEIWVANHLGSIDAVMMAVGAAFDFHAGTLPQAPEWMQKMGLEWFFRLLTEPRRLWKRYLITNSQFIFKFLYYKLILKRAV